MRFKCPHCGTRTKVADEFAGQVASCARCGRFMVVPGGPVAGLQTAASVDQSGEPERAGQPAVRRRRRVNRRHWLLLTGVILLIFSPLLIPLFTKQVSHGDRRVVDYSSRCRNNLMAIGVALQSYHLEYGCLPPAYTSDTDGRPMHCWRVLLLPFLGRHDLYNQYRLDEPWDSPHNIELLDQMPELFSSAGNDPNRGLANYVVIIGRPGESAETMFLPERGVRLSEVGDELAQTVVVAEVARGVPWTMPLADLELHSMTIGVNDGPASLSSNHGTAHVLMADGSQRILARGIRPRELRKMLEANDGEP